MIEPKPEIAKAIDDVYNLTLNLQRGETLLHDSIKDVLGVDPHYGSWDHVVNAVRRRLQRDRGIATMAEPTVGYKLLTIAEQLERLPKWRLKRSQRQLRRARQSVHAISPMEQGFSPHQARLQQFVEQSLRVAEKSVRRELKNMAEEDAPVVQVARRTSF